MNLLDWINQGIDGMTQVAGPGMDSLGFRIFIALLTTMMVWFGVQEALSSSQGGAGFNFAKFVHFVVLASFAYTLIEFYDNTIPGVGYSFRQFITVGSTDVAKIIGADGLNQLNKTVNDMQSNMGVNMIKAAMDTYYAIVIVLVQVLLAIYTAAITAIVAYGALAAAVVGLLGPVTKRLARYPQPLPHFQASGKRCRKGADARRQKLQDHCRDGGSQDQGEGKAIAVSAVLSLRLT